MSNETNKFDYNSPAPITPEQPQKKFTGGGFSEATKTFIAAYYFMYEGKRYKHEFQKHGNMGSVTITNEDGGLEYSSNSPQLCTDLGRFLDYSCIKSKQRDIEYEIVTIIK